MPISVILQAFEISRFYINNNACKDITKIVFEKKGNAE